MVPDMTIKERFFTEKTYNIHLLSNFVISISILFEIVITKNSDNLLIGSVGSLLKRRHVDTPVGAESDKSPKYIFFFRINNNNIVKRIMFNNIKTNT